MLFKIEVFKYFDNNLQFKIRSLIREPYGGNLSSPSSDKKRQ